MAVRDRSWRGIASRTPRIRRVSRYDLYLVTLPLVFLTAILIAVVAPVSIQESVFGASVVGATILADGLFVNPPDVGESK
ncbi:hypothetical protein [Halorhabdus amylolytica]|uniref:hypothetical protein n=1 Tax=Halorhabdus amylolytica TaxID=2559573 RepID=UPI0010A998E6|nr:hypothetical protein [Halorhabdus amylolytica]